MALNFDVRFKIPLLGLKMNGSHPEVQRSKLWYTQVIILCGLFTIVFIIIIYNIVCHDWVNKDFGSLCKNGTLALLYVMSAVQYGVLIMQRQSLIKLMNNVRKDYEFTHLLSEEEQAIVTKYSDDAVFICKFWFYMSCMGSNLFVVKSIILMVYFYVIGDFKLVQYYDLIYPEAIESRKTELGMFCIIYFFMIYYGYYSCVMYSSYVPLGPMMMLHACGQLEIVKKRIGELFLEHDDDVIMEKLRCIAKQLQYIYSFVDLLQDVFRIAYEVTLKATTIVLPVTGYEMIESLERGELTVEFLIFIVGGMLISSFPCYYSDLLMEKGETVRLALYECNWEQHYNRGGRSSLLILIIYALRPIAIKTLFKTLCLETLSELFQQAYTIFNLMNAMLEG